MTYGEALRRILYDSHVSQAQLARTIGKSNSYVSQLCKGKGKVKEPSVSLASSIGDALNTDARTFLDLMHSDSQGYEEVAEVHMDSNDYNSIGLRIASMRGFRRLTPEQLGDYVGVTKQTVSGWEHGKRTPDSGMLAEICRALDCSADYIIGLSDTPSGHFAGHA